VDESDQLPRVLCVYGYKLVMSFYSLVSILFYLLTYSYSRILYSKVSLSIAAMPELYSSMLSGPKINVLYLDPGQGILSP
jgi:hypothetical protein